MTKAEDIISRIEGLLNLPPLYNEPVEVRLTYIYNRLVESRSLLKQVMKLLGDQ